MSCDRNEKAQELLKEEIKVLRTNCKHTSHIIENIPDSPSLTEVDAIKKINSYTNGLLAAVQNSDTSISTNDCILTSQFLKDLKEKTVQIEELSAFAKGALNDIDAEIDRFTNLITIVNEAQSKPRLSQQEIQPEHLKRARDKFQTMKTTLYGLMQSLVPQHYDDIKELIGILMNVKLETNPDEYVQIESGNYKLIRILNDLNIISVNPYNNTEVKLRYS